MALELFAGMPVSDIERAVAWYDRLLGVAPVMRPHEHEAVWELGEGRFVYAEQRAGLAAGGGLVTVFADDFDERIGAIRSRGVEPADLETYANGVRKATFRDPDGNEFGIGGAPVDASG